MSQSAHTHQVREKAPTHPDARRSKPRPVSHARQRAQQEGTHRRQALARRAGVAGVGVIAAGLVALATVLPSGSGTSQNGAMASMGGTAAGPAVGTPAPDFSLTDVVSGEQVTRRSLGGHETLLFFSEGVSCQACLVQAADLQKDNALRAAGIQLVSVTTDPVGQLAEAARQYGIRTAMLADPTTSMSAAYGMLGHGGMQHPTQDGHAFMLLDAKGNVMWHRAYASMYVPAGQLLSDMGVKA